MERSSGEITYAKGLAERVDVTLAWESLAREGVGSEEAEISCGGETMYTLTPERTPG